MFKRALKCSVFVLMAIVIAACNQDDRHRDRDGNGASCYRNGHGGANCHKN